MKRRWFTLVLFLVACIALLGGFAMPALAEEPTVGTPLECWFSYPPNNSSIAAGSTVMLQAICWDADCEWNGSEYLPSWDDVLQITWISCTSSYGPVGMLGSITSSGYNPSFSQSNWTAPTSAATNTITVEGDELTVNCYDDAAVQAQLTVHGITVSIAKCPSSWLPKGANEDNTVAMTATISPPAGAGVFRFILSNISVLEGYCGNGPGPQVPNGNEDAADWRDMRFPSQSGFTLSGTDSCVATATSAANSKSPVVACCDYGAHCRISAEAYGYNGVWVTAKEEGGTNTFTTIPYDADEDGMADSWEADQVTAWNAQYGASETVGNGFFAGASDTELRDPDGDTTPEVLKDHAGTGDSLSALEEYRGYIGTVTDNKYAYRRLSPARKELLVEVDIMAENMKVGAGGTSTGLTDTKLTDTHRSWTTKQFYGMRLNPNTGQNYTYPITYNNATEIISMGACWDMDEVAVAGDTYSVSSFAPPTTAEVHSIMAGVQDAFMTYAGVQVYYNLDQTDAPWNALFYHDDRTAFMAGCRDTGVGDEDDYSEFVHYVFADSAFSNLQAFGLSGTPYDGGMTFTSQCRDFALRNAASGVTFIEAMTSNATHELGHCVSCIDQQLDNDYVMYKALEVDNSNSIQFSQDLAAEIPLMNVSTHF